MSSTCHSSGAVELVWLWCLARQANYDLDEEEERRVAVSLLDSFRRQYSGWRRHELRAEAQAVIELLPFD